MFTYKEFETKLAILSVFLNMISIHPAAKIGRGNSFGEGIIIGPNVVIGNNNIFGNYVSISGNVNIGNENIIKEFVSISGNVTIGMGNVIGVGSVCRRFIESRSKTDKKYA